MHLRTYFIIKMLASIETKRNRKTQKHFVGSSFLTLICLNIGGVSVVVLTVTS